MADAARAAHLVTANGARPWVVVRHVPWEGAGLFGEVARARGIGVEEAAMDRGERLPEIDEVAGLVVMGGPISATDEEGVPYLPPLRDLMADAVERETPVLGICLGGQILSSALGGRVERAPEPEFGLGDVILTPAGRRDPVFGPEGERIHVLQIHEDSYTLPEGAERLAFNEACPEHAFRVGRHAYGIQFHLEAVEDADLPARARISGEAAEALARTGRRVLDRFLTATIVEATAGAS